MNAQLVVGWDGSASARRALDWALRQEADALLLVQVVDGLDPLRGFGVGEDPEADAVASVQTAAADAQRAHPGAVIATHVVTGDPVTELARFTRPGSLLVVGDRRRAVLRFRAGWSVGARLAAIATGPVAVITDEDAGEGSGVLVGIDDSTGARAALEFAAAWAARLGETLYVLHAWHIPFLWHDRGMPPADYLAELTAQHADVLTDAVAEARRLQPLLHVSGSTVDGIAARALIDAAQRRSMLVVGSGAVSTIERMLLGSVSHDILLNLAIPTVIIGRHAVPDRRAVPLGVADAGIPDAGIPEVGIHEAGLRLTGAVAGTADAAPANAVVAWDGSPSSRSVLTWAVAREQFRHGSVEVVVIADEAAARPDSESAAAEVNLDERAVARELDRMRSCAPDVAVRSRVVRGFVLHTLAGLTRPDSLLVVGTEDRTGPRLRFGLSIGAHLPALARGPVAIIPQTLDATLTGVAVGVDGSERSNAAVLVAAAEAERRGETLHLVHAWTEPTLYQSTWMLDADFVTALENEHRSILSTAELFVRTAFPTLHLKMHLVFGEPARALGGLIPRAAVIVVGSRGLTGWHRMLLGSVSRELILNLEVPLIVVGHTDAPQPAPARASLEGSTGMQEDARV